MAWRRSSVRVRSGPLEFFCEIEKDLEILKKINQRRGAGAVERAVLEMRYSGNGIVSSNLTPAAVFYQCF